jgi:signal transduction histidine kinase
MAAAAMAAIFDGDSFVSAGICAALAAIPAAFGLIVTPQIRKEWAVSAICALWTALASGAVASTGGGATPLSVLFLVAPALSLFLNRSDMALEAALMSALAFLACIICQALGLIGGAQHGFAVAGGLGALAALIYVAGLILAPRGLAVAAAIESEPGLAPRFLAELAHELKTPLNAILGFSDVMRQGVFGKLPDKYAEYIETIHESGRHMLELINNLLDMSRLQAGGYTLRPEIIDARVVVAETVQMMRETARGAGVTLIAPGVLEPLRANADKTALKQILINLIANGIKYTPPGGSVTVRAEGDGALTITVADTGVGIPQDALDRIMRPFEQGPAAKVGAGLGLAVVRGLAELHGGRVKIDSPPGSGAVVIVTLPVLVRNAA